MKGSKVRLRKGCRKEENPSHEIISHQSQMLYEPSSGKRKEMEAAADSYRAEGKRTVAGRDTAQARNDQSEGNNIMDETIRFDNE